MGAGYKELGWQIKKLEQMKIKSITLQNYKRFVAPITFSFTNPDGEVNEKTLLIGNNGTGKSSVLQAIVALVASVTREKFKPSSLDWAGFNYDRLQTGNSFLKIEVEIIFEEVEVEATYEYAEKLKNMGKKVSPMPSQEETVRLYLDFANDKLNVKSNFELKGIRQFSGYQYAKQLTKVVLNPTQLFDKVGNIYFFHEQRNINAVTDFLSNKGDKSLQLDKLRQLLVNAYNNHQAQLNKNKISQEGEFNVYEKLAKLYSQIFTDRQFEGAEPHHNMNDLDKTNPFMLYDGKRKYELSEMSAGERAILPILINFAFLNINNSIIIIDELELHLHPPLQRLLVDILPKLGKNNQFIFTTHSDHVANMFNETENQIIYLSNE